MIGIVTVTVSYVVAMRQTFNRKYGCLYVNALPVFLFHMVIIILITLYDNYYLLFVKLKRDLKPNLLQNLLIVHEYVFLNNTFWPNFWGYFKFQLLQIYQ